MFAICIESSHKRGMGHLYRALNIILFLQKQRESYVVLINKDEIANTILTNKEITYEIVDYNDVKSNWEKVMILNYAIDIWINDKFESSIDLCKHIKDENILLVAIDDIGKGSMYADLHFVGMVFDSKTELLGKKIFKGKDYLILNPEIEIYKRKRNKLEKIIVSLGGSDTFGATVKILNILKNLKIKADIIIGPSYQDEEVLINMIGIGNEYNLQRNVPSLIEKFYEYDLAITGGGVTCFEANASGLPCIIVANEIHEIYIAEYLSSLGGAVFAGYHERIEESVFNKKFDIEKMSRCALKNIGTDGIELIYLEIRKELERRNGKNEEKGEYSSNSSARFSSISRIF